jgi:hypothetical protein
MPFSLMFRVLPLASVGPPSTAIGSSTATLGDLRLSEREVTAAPVLYWRLNRRLRRQCLRECNSGLCEAYQRFFFL